MILNKYSQVIDLIKRSIIVLNFLNKNEMKNYISKSQNFDFKFGNSNFLASKN